MVRLKCTIAYDGTGFSGYQIQPKGRTVQGVIEQALARIHKGRAVRVTASGRTDAGVHARGQVLHFDSELDIPEDGWKKALNSALPPDIAVRGVEYVSSLFHARFDAVTKEYRYRVRHSKDPDVFRRRYTYHYPRHLETARIKEAAGALVGTHDFSSFCGAGSEVQNKERTLETVDIFLDNDELIFRLVGNGFLYQMVRIIVGTLLEVGNGRRPPETIRPILQARDRGKAGPTAPGHGLFLWQVTYPFGPEGGKD
ncbi:MAG TPA: tRNA pseudouridine(38-40) synthase TruA [Bacillales bacterium]|nr:tRNA pseudouridine(38-40) synthase TruA [Bacillales bacterium]